MWRGGSWMALVVLAGLGAGCGDDATAVEAEGPRVLDGDTPLPAAVEGVLERNCWACHGDPTAMFAPLSIVNWEDTQGPASSDATRALFEVMDQRINDAQFPMPPIDRHMPAEDLQILNDWIESGTPSGP